MGLLETLNDLFNGGPIARRHPTQEKRNVDSLAQILEYSRGTRSYAGVPVDDDQAMRLGAVFACVDLLAELVSTLPVDVFKRQPSGPPKLLPVPAFLADPMGDGTGFEVWCRQVMTSLLLRGNAYGLVTDIDEFAFPRHIETLDPDRVSYRRDLNMGPMSWWLDSKQIDVWPDGPLWRLSAYSAPGSPVGMSPIRYAAETIGLGIANRNFGAKWFGDGLHPTAILESEDDISEAEAVLLKQRIYAAMDDNREALILGAGTKLTSMRVSPDESQFLETSQANVADVARYFRVPPEMIGGKAADNLTYANQEQRAISLLTFTVNPWLVRIERALSRLRPRGQYVKFNADALLRTDLKTRYEAHVLAIRGGFATPNERRHLEDEAPITGADELLWPPYSTGAGGPASGEAAPSE